MFSKNETRLIEKRDLIHIAILAAIALVIGVYLIATTVLIAKDGVFYIERAQQFASDPVSIIKTHSPGYPVLIYAAHQLLGLVDKSDSIIAWILSAQIVSLFARALAVILLYFTGKALVGQRMAFWAALILVMLPYPAHMASDVIRAWPHMLFFTAAFFLIVYGGLNGKCLLFGLAGLSAGIGTLFRIECVQLVIYGAVWTLLQLKRPKRSMSPAKLMLALFFLLIGFSIPVATYTKIAGVGFPDQRKHLVLESIGKLSINETARCHDTGYAAGLMPDKMLLGFGVLSSRVSENLMFFFVPPFLIGFFAHLKDCSQDGKRFFAAFPLAVNIAILIFFFSRHAYISRRHVLPMVALMVFYIPLGLSRIAQWMTSRSSIRESSSQLLPVTNRWFYVLLITGIVICLPKLVEAQRKEKKGYRDVARWLSANSSYGDIVSAPDIRIGLYADRETVSYEARVYPDVKYVVKVVDAAKWDRDCPAIFNVQGSRDKATNRQTDSAAKGGKPKGSIEVLSSELNGPPDFDGNGSILKTDLSMEGARNLTLSAWVKSGVPSQNGTIVSPRAWYNDFFFLRSINSRWYASLRWGGGKSWHLPSKDEYVVGKWYHLAACADVTGGKLYFYVNGVMVNSAEIHSNGLFGNGFNWAIGGTNNQFFTGAIDNVVVFAEAVSSDYIRALFDRGRSRRKDLPLKEVIEYGMVTRWRRDESNNCWIETVCRRQMRPLYCVFLDDRSRKNVVVVYEVLENL